MGQEEQKPGTGVVEKVRPEVKRPSQYKVVLHNDDYTTMEFVVNILETVFDKPPAEAHRIMLQVHLHGFGICGMYTHEVAETKVALVHEQAREHGFPLRASIEEA